MEVAFRLLRNSLKRLAAAQNTFRIKREDCFRSLPVNAACLSRGLRTGSAGRERGEQSSSRQIAIS